MPELHAAEPEQVVSLQEHRVRKCEHTSAGKPQCLQYEREDLMLTLGKPLYPDAWTQHTEAIVEPPAGSDVIDDWRVFFALAQRMSLPLFDGDRPFDLQQAPTSRELLAAKRRAKPRA